MPPPARKWKLPLRLQLLLIAEAAVFRCGGESSTCLTVYKQGGAPAVFQSPKCPLWTLPINFSPPPPRSSASGCRCQSAMIQGRRPSQEDRILCALDLRIPFPGKAGIKQVLVGIVAAFDGHNGAEASEMASKLLLEYFALHTYFLLDSAYSFVLRLPFKGERDDFVSKVLNWDGELCPHHQLKFERYTYSFSESFDDSFHLEILKEALLRAVRDIDATFSKEAARYNLDSGSTATVALIADGKILVANIGDSKAFLCTEKFQSPADAKVDLLRSYREQRQNGIASHRRVRSDIKSAASNGLKRLMVEELTTDHHPDRDDERLRVETAGGNVLDWGGIARVNGQLAVSRAIGDVYFKRYGVISAPEVTDWQSLPVNDSYLVVASDGMFEKLRLQDICDLLWEVHNHENKGTSSSCSYSLADCLLNTAFEKGSMDNMAAVVVPLASSEISEAVERERCIDEGDIYCSKIREQNFIYKHSAKGLYSHPLQLKHPELLLEKIDRLLVEGKSGHCGCYYLFENLNNNIDTFPSQKSVLEESSHGLRTALSKAFDHHHVGSSNLHGEQDFCLHSGMVTDGNKDQCINLEAFTSFLGLLESIPFHDVGSSVGSAEHPMPDLRYVLKKRFGRGSYGEVWLAFHWDCHQNSNSSSWSRKAKNFSVNTGQFDSNIRNSSRSSSCSGGCPNDDDLFILKRIMVEKGAAAYLSGLREKYFGEIFLNATRCLGGLCIDKSASVSLEELQSDFYDLLETNESFYGFRDSRSYENMFAKKFRMPEPALEEGLNHIVRYVESFESRSNEIWLVFYHEGLSLAKIMYTLEEVENYSDEEKVEEVKRVQVLRPSTWWHWLKTTQAGKEEMRNLIRQLLLGLKSCHGRNITHRDIKPENMVICFEDPDSGKCLQGVPGPDKNYTTKMRIIDFGSAIDDFTIKHFYGSSGPSRAEQTYEYTPPEALLNATWYQEPRTTNLKYDMWSVGVLMLELILGSPNVFQISSLTRALLDRLIENWNEDLKELAYKLRSFMELCILMPGSTLKRHHASHQTEASPAAWKCSEEFFSNQVKSRDPLKIGFPDIWAMRLVRKLLLWDPEDRLSVDEALEHPYFRAR